jgi:hypothetical protein
MMTWQGELEALIEETKAHVKAMGGTSVQPIVPKKPAVAEPAKAATAEPPRAQPIEPITRPSVGSEQEEIRQRVASFKAFRHGCNANAKITVQERYRTPVTKRRLIKSFRGAESPLGRRYASDIGETLFT